MSGITPIKVQANQALNNGAELAKIAPSFAKWLNSFCKGLKVAYMVKEYGMDTLPESAQADLNAASTWLAVATMAQAAQPDELPKTVGGVSEGKIALTATTGPWAMIRLILDTKYGIALDGGNDVSGVVQALMTTIALDDLKPGNSDTTPEADTEDEGDKTPAEGETGTKAPKPTPPANRTKAGIKDAA